MPLISFKNVAIGYDNGIIIDNLDFSLEEGDYLLLLGENGAGKSTLLKTMLSLIKPIKGKIIFDKSLKRNDIGYLPQQTQVQRDFPASIYEIVISGTLSKAGARPFYNKRDKQTAINAMKKMGIYEIRHKCYRELSGGQQQRVLLARAICSSNKVLVLDEPVTGLDPKATKEFYELVASLNRYEGMTIVMISHDLSALKYANKVLHLGHDVYFGKKEDYFESHNYQLFLGKGGESYD